MPTSLQENGKKDESTQSNVLFWFKSDLRLEDSRGLEAALNQLKQYRNDGLDSNLFCAFVINFKEFKNHDMAPIKFNFIIQHLHLLHQQLVKLNVPFIIEVLDASEKVQEKLLSVCKRYQVKSMFYNIEYEFNESKRDGRVTQLLTENKIKVQGFHDQCVIEPGKVLGKSTQKPYTVFTPFKDTYLHIAAVEPSHLKLSESMPTKQSDGLQKEFKLIFEWNLNLETHLDRFEFSKEQLDDLKQRFPAGNEEAHRRLDEFVKTKLDKYKEARDLPRSEGTSQLSPYLTVGSISLRTIMKRIQKENNGILNAGNIHKMTYILELVWRDFYRHILFNFIHVSKSLPFKLETKDLQWHYDEKKFEAWCQGKTGYPLVDAGMRQLNSIGWMHNRLRMVTATFLTKDLLINWQHGEKYFMSKLIDGDLASNNGGWQWSASTGTDAQPYFRIFNPKLQSERFDKEGDFIIKYVPELKSLHGKKEIHDPYKLLEKPKFESLGYPKPIVDHGKARLLAIETYAKVLKKAKA